MGNMAFNYVPVLRPAVGWSFNPFQSHTIEIRFFPAYLRQFPWVNRFSNKIISLHAHVMAEPTFHFNGGVHKFFFNKLITWKIWKIIIVFFISYNIHILKIHKTYYQKKWRVFIFLKMLHNIFIVNMSKNFFLDVYDQTVIHPLFSNSIS